VILKPDYIEHMHRNLIPEVILKGDFYIAHKRRCRVLFPRDFMARHQPLLETKTFKKSDMNFCHEDFVRFELCSTCNIALAKRI